MRYTSFLALAFLLSACGGNRQQQDFQAIEAREDMSDAEKATAKAELIEIGPRALVQLTESPWIALPLGYDLPNKKGKGWDLGSRGGSYGKDYDGPENMLYDVLFYNPGTGETHLLIDSCCVEMLSFMADSNLLQHLAGTHILYMLGKADSRHKPMLSTLYASDRTGHHFVQVSPPGFHVSTWQPVPGKKEILLVVRQDTNGDSLLTRADAPTLLLADISQTYPNLRTLTERKEFETVRAKLLEQEKPQ